MDSRSPLASIKSLKGALARVAKINAVELLQFIQNYFNGPSFELVRERDIRLATQFYYTLFNKAWHDTIQEFMLGIYEFSHEMVEEIQDVVSYNLEQIDHLPKQVLLFVREERSDAYGNTEVYRLLGLAKYVSHQGSAPISITYKLDEKLAMEILKTSNQIVKIV